jgi:acyl carrier protein phosphodiesterase
MNYLGHLYLAEDTPQSLVGNLLGDFVKGAISDVYPSAIRRGIELHRKVDAFTDSHNVFRSSIRLISPARRRFAGIMIDMFYDHFLAKHWLLYAHSSLPAFSQKVYGALQEYRELLPERLQRMLPYIIQEDWLTSYKEISAIDRALNRLSKRFKRENPLVNAAEELAANYAPLEADFHRFFPDLIDYARSHGALQRQDGLLNK